MYCLQNYAFLSFQFLSFMLEHFLKYWSSNKAVTIYYNVFKNIVYLTILKVISFLQLAGKKNLYWIVICYCKSYIAEFKFNWNEGTNHKIFWSMVVFFLSCKLLKNLNFFTRISWTISTNLDTKHNIPVICYETEGRYNSFLWFLHLRLLKHTNI